MDLYDEDLDRLLGVVHEFVPAFRVDDRDSAAMEAAFVAVDAYERVARSDVVELFVASVLMATDDAARRYRRHIDEVDVRLKRIRREHAPEDDRPKAVVFPLSLD